MFGKVWSVLLIVTLILCNTGTIAFAESVVTIGEGNDISESIIGEGRCGENQEWILYKDGILEITGTGDMYDYTYGEEYPRYEYSTELKRQIDSSFQGIFNRITRFFTICKQKPEMVKFS